MFPIPQYPGYHLTEDFQIIGKKGNPLSLIGDAYKFVNVFITGEGSKILYLHRAVALVHVQGYFEGAVVDHIDRNPRNNNPENLRWVTPSQNAINTQYHADLTLDMIDKKIAKLKKKLTALENERISRLLVSHPSGEL